MSNKTLQQPVWQSEDWWACFLGWFILVAAGGIIGGDAAYKVAALVKISQNVLIGVAAFLVALWAALSLDRKQTGHCLLDFPDSQCRLDPVHCLDPVVGNLFHPADISGLRSAAGSSGRESRRHVGLQQFSCQ